MSDFEGYSNDTAFERSAFFKINLSDFNVLKSLCRS